MTDLEYAISDDRHPIIESDDQHTEERTCCWNHKRFWCFSLVLAIILAGHVVAVYFIYFRCPPSSCTPIKIMSLNTWGMPALLGSQYKEARIKAIGEEFKEAKYDIYLFEELWMRPDYYVIRNQTPSGFHMTDYGELTSGNCDGRVTPSFCSGLAIASKFAIEDVSFNRYSYSGDPAKSFVDGEYLANKGAGRIRILILNRTVDVFVTHTAADPDPSHGYNNSYYRVRQVKQLVDDFLMQSDADVVLLAGDFNAEPDPSPEAPYGMIRQHMKNCVEDIFYKLHAWLRPDFATYGNKQNTFSYGVLPPVIYDYIFHRNQAKDATQIWTNWFELPFFKVAVDALGRRRRNAGAHGKLISFSDHEAITSTVYIKEL